MHGIRDNEVEEWVDRSSDQVERLRNEEEVRGLSTEKEELEFDVYLLLMRRHAYQLTIYCTCPL